ncbi:MAG: alanine racemase [Pseudomonadota bacterium]
MKREAVATVRLDALRHNLRVVRRLCPHSRVFAMVKANAYGHGLVPVARALGDADALGVATLDEALALREGGIGRPIVLIEGVCDVRELRLAAEHGFTLVVHNVEQADMLRRTSLAHPVDVWLKLETGMHRLGMPETAADLAVDALRPRVRQLGAMTHFACADETGNALTRTQLERLMAFARRHHLPASAANSAGIVSLPASHLDVVRPGIMLYGSSPVAGRPAADFDLQPVMTLHAQIIAVNEVPKGEGVGYGQTWHAPRDSRIGVVGIGYGDGYPRHAMPGTPVRLAAGTVPMVGRVSMDMIGIDLTAHPEARIGDAVELWGGQLPVDTVARHASTISYELFCRLTARVRFEYTG